VKRAGWGWDPPNHPADSLHIEVPRDAWSQVSDTPHRRNPEKLHESPHIKALESHIVTLREQLSGAEQRADRAEARLDQVLADLRNERTASAEERRRLLERIAELEAQLAQQSEPPAAEPPDVDAISADLEHEGPPPSAWLEEAWGAGASNDHSSTADPAHQVERLWQRIEELEHRLEAAKAERAGVESETPAEQALVLATAEAEGEAPEPPEQPRRWWRRMLRRR
jgi:hypothetical protein